MENPYQAVAGAPARTLTPSQRFAGVSAAAALAEFGTDAVRGLLTAQATERRHLHGANELAAEEEELLVKKFFSTFVEDKLILLLIGSAGVLFLMGNTDDAVSIALAVLIVVGVGFVQEYRSEKSLAALSQLVPAEAHLTRNGQTATVLALVLVPGDLVHVSAGDRVPADIRLTECAGLCIDELNLTGETSPVTKNVEADGNSRSLVAYMGTLVREGRGSGVVVGTGHATEFGGVFAMMLEIEKPKTPLQKTMDQLGAQLLAVSFAVIGVICLIGVVQGRRWLDMFQISVSLAVAAIPEGLPIIVTVTLALGVLRMSRHRAIVRRLPSVETLGSVNVICTDKTGTLTFNHMTVTEVWTSEWDLPQAVPATASPALRTLLEQGALCTNARWSAEHYKHVGNPTDIAFVDVVGKLGLDDPRTRRERTGEIAFSSSRKYMAVQTHPGDLSKLEVTAKGACDTVLGMCTAYLDASGNAKPLSDSVRASVASATAAMAGKGLRVVAVAKGPAKPNSGELPTPSGLSFCGLVGMNDPPRPTVAPAIARLMRGGVHVIMITGDSDATAVQIARLVGMPVHDPARSVLTGPQLDTMLTEALSLAIQHVLVFARTTPEHKVAIVRALQARGDIVAMTGDGVNDAPALKLADIGVAMGKSGTDVAKEAADMVLTDDDFLTILHAIEEGKGIFYNIQSFLTFQLSTSIAALSLVAVATVLGLPNPLNAMQILWINILMDGPPAQLLGVEPVDPAVMLRPPRRRDDKILTLGVVRRLLQLAVMIIVGTLFVYVREMSDNVVTARDTTMTFTCFVLFDMFNALGCRHATRLIFELGFTNKMFNLAVAGSLVGQLCAIYVPFFQSIFQTEALSVGDLVFLVAVTSTVFWADEARKWYFKTQVGLPQYSRV